MNGDVGTVVLDCIESWFQDPNKEQLSNLKSTATKNGYKINCAIEPNQKLA